MRHIHFLPIVLLATTVSSPQAPVPQTLTLTEGQTFVLPLDLVEPGASSVEELRLVIGFNPRLVEFIELAGARDVTARVSRVEGGSFHHLHVVWRPAASLDGGPIRLGRLRFRTRSPTAGEHGVRFPLHTVRLSTSDGHVLQGREVDTFLPGGAAPQVINRDRIVIKPKPERHQGMRLRIHPYREGGGDEAHTIASR